MAKPQTKKIKKDAVILTARDMLKGYVASNTDVNMYNMSPLQMIPMGEKDEDWKKWNLDWLERAGLRQLSTQSKRLVKNYHLANGILDKLDYMIAPENEFTNHVAAIAQDNQNVIPIKFFPLIPNVINILCGEFSKRDTRVIAKAVDEFSVNEAYEHKMQLLTQILVQKAEADKAEQLQQMGIDVNSKDPKVQQQVSQEMQAAEAMAEAEVKFKKYRGIAEQWANHILEMDNDRFNLYEMEALGFRDMLVTDREFWHVRVKEDDYDLELWNPTYTFYHKSPDVQYISEGNYVGRMRMMSIPDIIDLFGDKMTEDQLLSLKNFHRMLTNFPLVVDSMKSQENWYTDFSKPYNNGGKTNVTWQKWLDGQVGKAINGDNSAFAWYDLNNASEGLTLDINGPGMARVTESYWKSQKRVGHLTWIKKDGTLVQDIVDENFEVYEKPMYDTSLNKAKTKETLISGEHIDWIWINEVRYGVKINNSVSTYYTRNYSDFEPIYIGGDVIPFQFKGQNNLYGCKLPVEGRIFTERNSFSSSLVDKMKPSQINFNIVNNQIVEMLADEIGNVFVIDQNMIPRNSLGGQWGPNNFPMFHQVMRDYQIAAIDPSIRNTEGATNFSHFQAVDMTKTQQIMSRVELAKYFKEEAFSVVGITPQRVGQVTASETATGTQQAVNNSYAQTEPYFDQHMNYLMPRVRLMMLEAAQFLNATKPISRINYLNSDDENILFDIEGYRLLLPHFHVYARSTANVKALVEQLRQLAIQNNTAGGSLAEMAEMLTLQSPAEIIAKLKEAEANRQQQTQAQQDHEMQLQQQQQQFLDSEEQKNRDFQAEENQKQIDKDIYIAEIKALGYAKDQDLNNDSIPDPLEVQGFLHQQGLDYQNQVNKESEISLKRQDLLNKMKQHNDKMQLAKEKMKSDQVIEKEKLKVVKANKAKPKSK
jgi:hypothetical protein